MRFERQPGLRDSSVTFQQGERLRIRTKNPMGHLLEAFWYTVDTQGMTLNDVALQFAQTGQPGMFIEIVSGKLKWTFQQGKYAVHPSVTRVHGTPSSQDLREVRATGPTPDFDPFYIIQGLYNPEGFEASRSFGFNDEDTAIAEAKKLLNAPWFEGDYVRIITRDGELVWDSRGGERTSHGTWALPEGLDESRRRPARRMMSEDHSAEEALYAKWMHARKERDRLFRHGGPKYQSWYAKADELQYELQDMSAYGYELVWGAEGRRREAPAFSLARPRQGASSPASTRRR